MSSRIITVDYHTAGEPFRIVAEPPVPLHGNTVRERCENAISDPDVQLLRRILCFEPRGHAGMYGGFVVPPDDNDADVGIVFWHKDGYSLACGHGTIALAAWAVDTGIVAAPQTGLTDVVIDAPAGRVRARVHRSMGRVTAVEFVNVPSYVVARDVQLETSRGRVSLALAFGGSVWASVSADELRLALDIAQLPLLIAIGREIRHSLSRTTVSGAFDLEISGIVLHGNLDRGPADELHQRSVTIYGDGEVDRSPCGSGTSARLAILAAEGVLAERHCFLHESLIGSVFECRILKTVEMEGGVAVIPQITGTAYRTGEHIFFVDEHDPLVPGFLLG